MTTEYPTPGANLARNRMGQVSPPAAAPAFAIADYVRRGGAIARLMLLQAAADEWNVAGRSVAYQQRHHSTDRPHDHLRQGCRGSARLTPPTEVALKTRRPDDRR